MGSRFKSEGVHGIALVDLAIYQGFSAFWVVGFGDAINTPSQDVVRMTSGWWPSQDGSGLAFFFLFRRARSRAFVIFSVTSSMRSGKILA